MSHFKVARVTHIGRNVPDEIAHGLMLKRLWLRTVVNERGCWLWQGSVNSKGYGTANCQGKRIILHRWSYAQHVGELEQGKLICHACDNPNCWNPKHLWQGTPKQNSLDMSNKGRQRWQRHTHCQRGHEFTEENTWVFYRNGRPIRKCRACSRGIQRIRSGWSPEDAYTAPAIAPDQATERRFKRAAG
jgi:hypothetical protein